VPLRVVEVVGFGDVARLSLVPGVMIPHKFKVPEFKKYQAIMCPKSHMTMYDRKIVAYAYDWYTHLEPSRIHS